MTDKVKPLKCPGEILKALLAGKSGRSPVNTVIVLTICTAMFFCIPVVQGGLPEPGVLLFGPVHDFDGQLLTSGQLTWAITNTGDPSAGPV